jgi:TonB family protein
MSATTLAAAMPARRNGTSGSNKLDGRRVAWIASLLLHGALLLFALDWFVPHEIRAPHARQIGPVISLGELLKPDQSGAAQAEPKPPAARPHAAKPTHAKAATPPAAAPSHEPSPTQLAEATKPQPQNAADPGPQAPAADPAPAAAAQGASTAPEAPDELPIAYLTEISGIIMAHRIISGTPCTPRLRQRCVVAKVHLRLASDGSVISAGVVESAGSREFDQEALDVIRSIGKFPPPPAKWLFSDGVFPVDQPIRFYPS